MDLLTLTVREAAATVFPLPMAENMLSRAKVDFPEYRLVIERRECGAVVRTDAMPVKRWLRT
jgi:hypothetical protein